MTELPKYRCHKVVEAVKIVGFSVFTARGAPKGQLLLKVDGYPDIEVSDEWWGKHKPKENGYFVRYEDGYESFSPAEAFEAGYTLMQDPQGSGGAPG